MAIEVTKVYKEHFPALRFIGKRYTNDDRGQDGGFGKQWGEWMSGDAFTKMKEAVISNPFSEDTLGLMTMCGDMTGFTYWIGLFFPAETNVPDGYDSLDLPESDIGVGWVRGYLENGEIFGGPPHEAVCKKIEENEIGSFRNDIAGSDSNTYCFFERYNCPRFTEKDKGGNVTLDYGNYIIGRKTISNPAIVTFQIHQEAFSFLGIENIVTESSDFGYFWDNFFKMGGYDKINLYAIDTKPINVWYTNNAGNKIYFQGLMVNNVENVPDGYTLAKFPASDFLVVTYEWVLKQDFQMMYEINGGWKYIETLQIPNGYVRYDGPDSPITIIEKENTNTPDGSRYEFWIPIKKQV